jgi:hypothetical protein
MRQALVDCGNGQRLKVQLARQIPIWSGEAVSLRLHRALVYRNGTQPLELRPHDDGAAVLPFRRAQNHHHMESARAQ